MADCGKGVILHYHADENGVAHGLCSCTDPYTPKPRTYCRCCGNAILGLLEQDGYPIHTRCIPKHWGKHATGINASRCKEFGKCRAST